MGSKAGTSKAGAGLARPPVRHQVAAVCYRCGARGIEFLLVRTRGGRWIFPKGGVEPGLTQAQSAALEAFEEAGVHGRIEEMPFARYRREKSAPGKLFERTSKGKNSIQSKSSRENKCPGEQAKKFCERGRVLDSETVTAHLCEVSYLESPQEPYRTPTWFSPAKAKRRLAENRSRGSGQELASVVDRARSRIRRLEASAGQEFQNDALRKVRFEACEVPHPPRERNGARLRRLLIDQSSPRIPNTLEVEPVPPARRKKNYIQ